MRRNEIQGPWWRRTRVIKLIVSTPFPGFLSEATTSTSAYVRVSRIISNDLCALVGRRIPGCLRVRRFGVSPVGRPGSRWSAKPGPR